MTRGQQPLPPCPRGLQPPCWRPWRGSSPAPPRGAPGCVSSCHQCFWAPLPAGRSTSSGWGQRRQRVLGIPGPAQGSGGSSVPGLRPRSQVGSTGGVARCPCVLPFFAAGSALSPGLGRRWGPAGSSPGKLAARLPRSAQNRSAPASSTHLRPGRERAGRVRVRSIPRPRTLAFSEWPPELPLTYLPANPAHWWGTCSTSRLQRPNTPEKQGAKQEPSPGVAPSSSSRQPWGSAHSRVKMVLDQGPERGEASWGEGTAGGQAVKQDQGRSAGPVSVAGRGTMQGEGQGGPAACQDL